jgi:Polyprenyl synthetase
MKNTAILFYQQSTTSTCRVNILQSLYMAVCPLFFTLLLLLIYCAIAITIAGAHSEEDQRAAYLYGTYVGQAFQLIDDALDFEGEVRPSIKLSPPLLLLLLLLLVSLHVCGTSALDPSCASSTSMTTAQLLTSTLQLIRFSK